MKNTATFRGQPLLLLGGLLVGWVCLRVGILQASWEEALQADPLQAVASTRGITTGASSNPFAASRALMHVRRTATMPASAPPPRPHALSSNLLVAVAPTAADVEPAGRHSPSSPPYGVPSAAPSLGTGLPVTSRKRLGRLSADGWLLLRQDSTARAVAPGPSYGRSQAGAILRYDLAPESSWRPQAYLRVSGAIEGPREQQLAAGLSFRPLREFPVRIAAEARVTETTFGKALDPAAYAVSELPPIELPLNTRGEVYLQAGYLGGRNATGFVDGQARVERLLSRIGSAEVRVGGGVWGGAQKGSARLDFGPSVAAMFPVGEAYARLAIDYRIRIAGDATPVSGPALTLSAGF